MSANARSGLIKRQGQRRRRQVLLLIQPHRTVNRRVIAGIARYAREHGQWSFLTDAPLSPDKRIPNGWCGDGIIGDIVLQPLADQIRALGVPAVNLRSLFEFPAVIQDRDRAGELVAEHFLDLGLRQFAYFGMPRAVANRYHAGYLHRLQLRGHRCHVSSLYRLDHRSSALRGPTRHRLRRWLRELPKPVGIYAQDDVAGWVIVDTCRELGIAVPDEVALMSGTYDEVICETLSPSLSSVTQAGERRGAEAARLLNRLMRGERPPSGPVVVPPVGIVARESSDMLAIADPVVARAMRVIREAAPDQVQVQDVVQAVAFSRSALDKRFRAAIGRTVAEMIRRMRLERAKQLLITTDQPLSTVARTAGFSTAQYMSLCFRREMRTSPGRFRERIRRR